MLKIEKFEFDVQEIVHTCMRETMRILAKFTNLTKREFYVYDRHLEESCFEYHSLYLRKQLKLIGPRLRRSPLRWTAFTVGYLIPGPEKQGKTSQLC